MAAAAFSLKNQPIDWDAILAVNVEALSAGKEQNDALLDGFCTKLCRYQLKMDGSDPMATPENVAKFFQLTQLVLELQHIYVEEDTVKINEQYSEIQRLQSSINKVNSSHYNYDAVRKMEGEIVNLEQRNQFAVRNLQAAEKALEREKSLNLELNKQIGSNRERIVELEEEVEKLLRDIQDYKNQFSKLREAGIGVKEEEYRNVIKDKNSEITKYLDEIRLLSEKNAATSNELEEVSQELEVTLTTVEKLTNEQKEARRALEESDRKFDMLMAEKTEIQAQLNEFASRFSQKETAEESLLDQLQTQNQIAALQESVLSKESVIESLERDLLTLRNELATSSIGDYRAQIEQKDALGNELNSVKKEFELLSVEWDRMDKSMKASELQQDLDSVLSTNEGTAIASRKANGANAQIEKLKEFREQDLERIKVMEETLNQKEIILIELRQKLEKFEQGVYGMKEASAEIEDLKIQRAIRDNNIKDLTAQVNQLMKEFDSLSDENEELRSRLGVDNAHTIDISDLRKRKHVEIEKLKATNIALRKEIDALEEERIKMKSQLRLQAMEKGERAIKLGLKAEDLITLEDYANKLRQGSDKEIEKKHTLLSREDEKQIDKLTKEFERIYHELRLSREERAKLETQVRQLEDENRLFEFSVRDLAELLRVDGDNQTRAGQSLKHIGLLLDKLDARKSSQSSNGEISTNGHETLLRENSILKEKVKTLSCKYTIKNDELKSVIEAQKKQSNGGTQSNVQPIQVHDSLLQSNKLASLMDRLLIVYDEVCKKDLELDRSSSLLEDINTKIRTIAVQVCLLYKAFADDKTELDSNIKEIKEERDKFRTELELLKEKNDNLENLVSSFGSNSEEINEKLIDMSRKNIVLKVNQKALTRRCVAFQENEILLKQRNTRLQNDLSRLQIRAEESIMNIRLKQKSSQTTCDLLQSRLMQTVPKSSYDSLWLKYQSLSKELQNHMISELSLRTKHDAASSAEKYQIKELKGLLAQRDEEISKYSELINRIESIETENENVISSADQKRLIIENEVLKTKLVISEKNEATFKETDAILKNNILNLQDKFLRLNSNNEKLLKFEKMKEEINYQDSREPCPADMEKFRAKYALLEDAYMTLQTELKTVNKQLSDFVSLQTEKEKENDVLKCAVLELQARSDEKLLVGKLHQQIIGLQIAEADALHRLHDEIERNRNLQILLISAEKLNSDNEQALWNLRLQYQEKVLDLEYKLLSWKHECFLADQCLDLTLSNDSPPSQSVFFIKYLEKCTQYEGNIKQLKSELSEANNRNAILSDKLDAYLAKETVGREIGAEIAQNQTIPNSLLEVWTQKLIEAKQFELRSRREKAQADDKLKNTIAVMRDYETRINSLENESIQYQTNYEAAKLDWERKKVSLETKINDYEKERDQHMKMASISLSFITKLYSKEDVSTSIASSLPDPSQSIGKQLEMVLRTVGEKQNLINEYEQKISHIEAKCLTLETEYQKATQKLKDAEISNYSSKNIEVSSALNDEYGAKGFQKEKFLLEEQIKIIGATVESLRRQLDVKESQLQKYQNILQRSSLSKKTDEDVYRSEIAKLNLSINDLTNENSRLVRKLDSLEALMNDSGSQEQVAFARNVDQIFTKNDLEISIKEKEESIIRLNAELASLRASTKEQLSSQKNVDELQADYDLLQLKISEKVQSIADLENELQEKKKSEETIEKELLELKTKIEAYEKNLRLKSNKERSLCQALENLKEEFLNEASRLAAQSFVQLKQSQG